MTKLAFVTFLAATLIACSGGTWRDTTGQGLCVPQDNGCIKTCREQFQSYKDGLPRSEANQIYNQCAEACRPSGCDTAFR
ncbi:MAG: hypothetical protein AAF742_04575 [Pseudomonadota bacterium]